MSNHRGLDPYTQGIADFVGRMSADYRKHSGDAVHEDMLMAVAYFNVPPSAFYEDAHDRDALQARAEVYRLTGEARSTVTCIRCGVGYGHTRECADDMRNAMGVCAPDVPHLVAEVERLREELQEARVTIQASVGQYNPPPGYDSPQEATR
jgi:hypothetical protein